MGGGVAGDRVAGVERIAVLRANRLGDLVFALPALDALRAAYPAAEIVLLGRPWHAELYAGRPAPVDRVVPVPGTAAEWRRAAADPTPALAAFLGRARRERFDLALQIHGGGRESNHLVRALGARVTAGLATADAPPLDRTVPYLYYQPEVLRYLEAVSLVGAPPVTVEPALALTAADLRAAAGLPDPRPAPLVVVHPGASDPRRRWPASSFARVGDALARAGAAVVVVGDAAERPLVDEVAGLMSAPASACAGGLSLPGLVGLLGRATLVVGNDSGPLHLAEAVGTATVGVYWCGNLLTAGPVTRRRHRPAVSWRLACPVCGVDCTAGSCPHDASFVAEVPVEQVCGPALELLAAERDRPAAAS